MVKSVVAECVVAVAGVSVARDSGTQHVVLHALYVTSEQHQSERLHCTRAACSQAGITVLVHSCRPTWRCYVRGSRYSGIESL